MKLKDSHVVDTVFGEFAVGFDPDSETYVAESPRLSQPQRGRTEAAAVEKLVGLMQDRSRPGALVEEGGLYDGAYGLPEEELP